MSRTPDEGRRAELLERAVDYVLQHGLADLSLRPLAKAVGSSPRVLLHYFGSKERLVVEIIRRGRARQQATMANVKLAGLSPRRVSQILWQNFSSPQWEPLMRLFFEVYALSMQDRTRFPGFLESAVDEWLKALEPCTSVPGFSRDDARAYATILIAGYRGFLLDLCATRNRDRVDRAVDMWLAMLDHAVSSSQQESDNATA